MTPLDAPSVLRAAYVASGRTQSRFAREVLGVSLSAFTDWLRGEPCLQPVVSLCWLIAERPERADEVMRAFGLDG